LKKYQICMKETKQRWIEECVLNESKYGNKFVTCQEPHRVVIFLNKKMD